MRDGKQTEASGDSHAFMDALWSAFTAKRCDVEVKVLGLIEAHDAGLLESSQGQGDRAEIIRRVSEFGDASWNTAIETQKDQIFDSPRNKDLIRMENDLVEYLTPHPQPAQGQRDEANGELERLVVMIDRVYCDEDYEIPNGETSWSAIDEVRRLLLAAHPQPDGWRVVLRKARDAMSCPMGTRANFLMLEAVREIDALLSKDETHSQPEPSQKPDACVIDPDEFPEPHMEGK